LSNVGGASPRANAAEGKVDAIAPVAMVANAARRVTSLFMLRAVDALMVGAEVKAFALATIDRVIAVENFILMYQYVQAVFKLCQYLVVRCWLCGCWFIVHIACSHNIEYRYTLNVVRGLSYKSQLFFHPYVFDTI
jgi:hypothetical protein